MAKSWKVLLSTGVTCVALGLFLALSSNVVLDMILTKSMVLSNTSQSYPMWKDVSMDARMYIFNLTNPTEFLNGSKPKLQQLGPYSYKEFHNKTNLVWNPNNSTVTYEQARNWHYISGNLDDKVTIINAPMATLGAIAKYKEKTVRGLMEMGIALLGEKLVVTKSVREVLFEGYKDPLLDAGEFIKKFNIDMPGLTDRFGFYYGRNGTPYIDGVWNVRTGYDGLNELGRVATWNFTDHVSFFKGSCGRVEGSADLFPPYIRKEEQVLYSNDLCRPIRLEFDNADAKVYSTPGYEFKLTESFFANSDDNPENRCFETGSGPLPSGIYNVSACRFGAPVYISQPHFFQASKYYTDQLAAGSVKANASLHETAFIFEPESGVPMSVKVRMQVNLLVEPIEELNDFKNLRRPYYVPTIWFENSLVLSEDMVAKMWWLGNLKKIQMGIGGGLLGVGISLIVVGLFHYSAKKAGRYESLPEQPDSVHSPDEDSNEIVAE